MDHARPAALPMTSAPFLVAHRAANRLNGVRTRAASLPALLEADLRLRRDRVEVRHLKRLGPLPLLWDKWLVAPGWRPRLTLEELLAETPADVELMLDLKGRNPRLTNLVVAALDPYLTRLRITVCAREWKLLDAFAALPVRKVHSVGSRRGLRRLERLGDRPLDGVSIHERLLTPAVVERLAKITNVTMTWPVNDPGRARELLGLGVQGLITDDIATIAPCVEHA